jgi:threonine synthase
MAFSDAEFSEKYGLTSANSINIARLIPQMLYYFYAWGQIQKINPGKKVVFSVPSGNFGNICAAAFAVEMGLPVEKLIAAVNSNKVFPQFLQTGQFEPKPSVATLSNAMDVGNPSNFSRIEALLGGWNGIKKAFKSYSFSDDETEAAEFELFEKYGYLSEPHAAVGYLGARSYQIETGSESVMVFLGTAHPAKFIPVLPPILRAMVEIPQSLSDLKNSASVKQKMEVNYSAFKKMIVHA